MASHPKAQGVVRAGLAALVVAATCLGCGGGSEVAPANPIVRGDGSASIELDGVALPPTETVMTIVSEVGNLAVPVTETVTLVGDVAQLSRVPLSPTAPVTVTGVGSTPTYTPVDDYSVNTSLGVLTRNPTGAIPANGTVVVSYTYNQRLVTVELGATLVSGADASVRVFNLQPPTGGPLTINTGASSPPGDGSLAFATSLQTGLVQSTGQAVYVMVDNCSAPPTDPIDCPVRNELTLLAYDISNELNPCIEGSLRATVHDSRSTDPTSRSVLEMTFDDPDCD